MTFHKVVLKDTERTPFRGVVVELLKNGFVAVRSAGWLNDLLYGEQDIIRFKDVNYKKVFVVGDLVCFRVENVDKKKVDSDNVFYGVVTTLSDNGFYYSKNFQDKYWSDVKGFLTSTENLSDCPYETGDWIKIEVRRVGKN